MKKKCTQTVNMRSFSFFVLEINCYYQNTDSNCSFIEMQLYLF